MTKETQRPWPPTRSTGVDRTAPSAFFTSPDGYLKSERSLAGPLRRGTAPGVGPKGNPDSGGNSDFGMDRVSPRRFDPMGTYLSRDTQTREPSPLISRELRGPPRKG